MCLLLERPETCDEDVGPLAAGRDLREQLVEQDHYGPLVVACQTVEPRRLQASRPPFGGIFRCEARGELGELGRRGGRTAGGRLPRGDVQLGCDSIVRIVGGEREVAGPFLEFGDDPGERAVDRTALPGRSLSVTDGREQRVGETNAEVVELENALTGCGVERLEDAISVSVRRRDEL